MAFPPPEIARRPDGVMLHGWRGCREGASCQLIVQVLPRGLIRLSYHGTEEHSIILDRKQRAALVALLGETAG